MAVKDGVAVHRVRGVRIEVAVVVLAPELKRVLASDQRHISAPLPDIVALKTAARARDAVGAKSDVDQRIAEDLCLVHSDARAREVLGAGNGFLSQAAAIRLIGTEADFKGRSRAENMDPARAVVDDVEPADIRYTDDRVGVDQGRILTAVAEEEAVGRIQVVVPADVEQVAVIGLADI